MLTKELDYNILHTILGGNFVYMQKTAHMFQEFSLTLDLYSVHMLMRQNIRNYLIVDCYQEEIYTCADTKLPSKF